MSLIRRGGNQMQQRSPFSGLDMLRNEINRLFESPLESGMFPSSEFFQGWSPAIDVYDEKDQIRVEAEMPGMKKEEIDVTLHENTLTITGERKQKNENIKGDAYRSERFFGRFQRSISLPHPVNHQNINASYKDGILCIVLPKAEEAKRRQIEINAS